MISERDYSADVEFSKLLLRDSDVDLTVVALEIARDADPKLQFEPTLSWIAARAAELSSHAAGAWSEADSLRALSTLLTETYGLMGDEAAYQHAESSYLSEVIARKRGIPISLSILYMAIAKEIGIDLRGVAAPQHFLTRFDGVEGTYFVDPFVGGRIMDRDDCLRFLHEITNMPESELKPCLKPADTRAIVIRKIGRAHV